MFLLLFYPSHRLGKHWSVSFEQMEVIPLPDDIILDERTTTKPSLCGFPKDASYVLFFELTGENSFKKNEWTMAFWIRDNNIFCLRIYNLGKVNAQTIVKEKSWFCLADSGSFPDFY